MTPRQVRFALVGVAPVVVGVLVVLLVVTTSPDALAPRIATVDGGCTAHVSSLGAATSAVARSRPGGVVCLDAGHYPSKLSLAARPAGDVVLRATPGAHVSTGPIAIAGSHIVVRGLWVHGEVALAAGDSHVTIDHDDITGGGEGIVFDTSDCTVPKAPKWSGCEPMPPIGDITISANHIHDIGAHGGEDAIHLDNWRNVRITGNEFDHIIEAGEHTDCMQSVYGGDQLTFDHNYEHDNNCQGFFIKDGDATNVSFTDNLFVRDHIGSYANYSQIWNVRGLTVRHNTIWDGKGLALRADEASFTPTAIVDHNVIVSFVIERSTGAPYAISEHDNLFGLAPWSFRASRSDRTVGRLRFMGSTRGDYRLARNPRGIGVDWSPAARRYGPAS
ncbi:MAG: right-handed parallel beta-helix repeat-containing protein [Solirubrobacteraceae bacterium]